MLKVGNLARREDRRVKGLKIGKTRRDRVISHLWLGRKRRSNLVATILNDFYVSSNNTSLSYEPRCEKTGLRGF